eukprot:2430514-Rhodomonas_salina.1
MRPDVDTVESQPKPDFMDVTWTLDSGKRTMEMLVAAKALCALDVQMHLACTGITQAMAADLLSEAVDAGVRSILALRGDAAPGQQTWVPTPGGFKNAGELVSFIRQQHGDFFSIAVAGHPAGHTDSASREEELRYLKAKVDAGADYIVTQIFFKVLPPSLLLCLPPPLMRQKRRSVLERTGVRCTVWCDASLPSPATI